MSTGENHQISDKQVPDKKKTTQANSYQHIASLDESTHTAADTKAIVVAEDKILPDKTKQISINSSTQRQLDNNSKKNPVNNRSGGRTAKKASQEKRTKITPNLQVNQLNSIKKQQRNQQQDEQLAHIFKFKLRDYSIKIYKEEENWQADVKEKIGYFSRKHTLSVYFETGISLEKLTSLPQSIQKKYIHVILPKPNIAQKGHIYIGKLGLLGGMMGDEENQRGRKIVDEEVGDQKREKQGKDEDQAGTVKRKKGEGKKESRDLDIKTSAQEKTSNDPGLTEEEGAKVRLKSVNHFTNEERDLRKFDQIYSTEALQYLANLYQYPNVLQYVFNYPSDDADFLEYFKKQFTAMDRLQKDLNRTSCFIFVEPASMNTSHFILGVCEGSNLLLINPLGLTKHKEFYQAIDEITEEHGIQNVYISTTVIQKESNTIVSCGPICAELCMHIASLDKPLATGITPSVFDQIKETLKDQLKEDQIKKTQSYVQLDITELLPDTLKVLVTVKEEEKYVNQVISIREKHLHALEDSHMLEEQNDEQALLFEIAFNDQSLEDVRQSSMYRNLKERQDLTQVDTSFEANIAISVNQEEEEQVNNRSPFRDDYQEDEETKRTKMGWVDETMAEETHKKMMDAWINDVSKEEEESKNSEKEGEAIESKPLEGERGTIIRGIKIVPNDGRQHIREIRFQKDQAQQVAPHLINLEPWVDIPDFVVITGKNGAGKSQLLRYINGILSNNTLGINVLLREPDYCNNNIHFNNNRDVNFHINGSVQRKNLIQAIRTYYKTKEMDPREGQHPVYKAIIEKINEGLLPDPSNKGWYEEVGRFIDSYRDYGIEGHNVNEPISILSQIFNIYTERINRLLQQYRDIEYLGALFAFYCEKEASLDSESVNLYKSFLSDVREENFITNLIELYIKEKLNILPPWEEINKILEKYKFTYRVRFMRNDRGENLIFEKNIGQNIIPVKLQNLSSGERLMLDLMAWLFYFQGVSANGENPAQIKHLDIMLLDEPDRHLDPELCRLLYEVVYNEFVLKRHIQVIMTTHRLDTVISAPENIVYVMNKESLEHDINSAVSRMTSNVIECARNSRSAASILSNGRLAVIEDVNYVLVENEPDVQFYNIVYQKFLASRHLKSEKTKLIFEPVGISLKKVAKKAEELQSYFDNIKDNIRGMLKSTPIQVQDSVKLETLLNDSEVLIKDIKGGVHYGGGCGQVKKKVNEISLYEGKYDKQGKVIEGGYLKKLEIRHRSQVRWGMIDNDSATKQGESNAEGHVHAIDEVYSFENYLCMPLNLFYHIRHHYGNQHYHPKLLRSSNIDNILDFKEESATEEGLQKISDYVVQYLQELNAKRENQINIFPQTGRSGWSNRVSLQLIGNYKIEYPKGFLIERGHNLLQGISTIILNEQGEDRMRDLLFSALERMPVGFLASRLLTPMKLLQHSEVISKNLKKKEEGESSNSGKRVDHGKILKAIIKNLNYHSKLEGLLKLQNSNQEIVLVLPRKINKQDFVTFCKDKFKMAEEQIKHGTDSGDNNMFTLLLSSQEQIKALQEAIKEEKKAENSNKSEPTKKNNSSIIEEDKKNAFNQGYNNTYWYKEGDVGLIGKQLLKKIEKVEFIGVCDKNNTGIKNLIECALNDGKGVVGIFNLRNHWISFLIYASEDKNNLTIYIKDSLGSNCKPFQGYLKELKLLNISEKQINFKFHSKSEQIEKPKVHCGLFALKNASIMAQMENFDLEKYEEYEKFYNPKSQATGKGNPLPAYNNILAELRKEYAIIYLQSQYEYLLNSGLEDAERKKKKKSKEQIEKKLKEPNPHTNLEEIKPDEVEGGSSSNELGLINQLLEQLHIELIKSTEIEGMRELLGNTENLDKKIAESILSEIKNTMPSGNKSSTDLKERSEEYPNNNSENRLEEHEQLAKLKARQDEIDQKMKEGNFNATDEKELEQVQNEIKQIKGKSIEK